MCRWTGFQYRTSYHEPYPPSPGPMHEPYPPDGYAYHPYMSTTPEYDHHYHNHQQQQQPPMPARFFVIKSFSEEDVCMSLQHQVWSSTELGNRRLDK